MEIKPIESFVFDGILKRFTEVFQCRAAITTTNDKTRTLERFFSGNQVEYPYAFLTVQSVAHNKDSYQNTMLTRRGVRISTSENQIMAARILPTNFSMEVEFHTNKFSGIEPQTVMGYARRWLFAYKCGYLKFNIQYGQLETRIGVTLDESVSTPPLENRVENEAVYKITSNLVVHGYTSEPILGSQGRVSDIDLQMLFGSAQGYDFVPFE
jgi:hypothetical protein